LRSIAIRIEECVGSRDVVARVSSDEFMVLLHEVHWVGNPAAVADRIGKRISEPHVIQGHELQLTGSIGIAIYPEDGVTADELTGHSDLAMSDAKAQGRGKCCFFTKSMNETAREEIRIEQGMRQAMDRDELSLLYQPQVDGTTGELVGAEALLRWEGPDGKGEFSPTAFVPLAESVGLIHEIGSWVLREACRQKRVWEDEGLGDFPISINISPKQIAEPGFVERIEGILRDTRLRSDHVVLEVTESTIMVDSSDAAQTLSELRAKGMRIAVDDFGTGYSSMRLLDLLPFDVLKIDRCFVEGIESNPKRQAFVTSIVALAESLGLKTVTEGVETEAELNFLLGIGCRTIQGYFVGMPMSPMEFTITFMQRLEKKPEE
jgi:EAL domain-containing protein (putative c-di-GMP-specific phosphodiesterase class I)